MSLCQSPDSIDRYILIKAIKHISENGSSENWNSNIRLIQKQRHTDSKPGVVYIVQDSVWKNQNYWKV